MTNTQHNCIDSYYGCRFYCIPIVSRGMSTSGQLHSYFLFLLLDSPFFLTRIHVFFSLPIICLFNCRGSSKGRLYGNKRRIPVGGYDLFSVTKTPFVSCIQYFSISHLTHRAQGTALISIELQ